MVSNNIITFARKRTYEHTIDYPHRVCAVIHRGSQIICYGLNNPFKTHAKSNTPYGTIHAEFDAIQRAARLNVEMRKASLYVYRLRRDWNQGLARPCKWCERLILWSGIKDVNWSE